jgi:23S rRNA pseudouridine1911/1915/1917 synthase
VKNQGWSYREQVAPKDAGQSILSYYTRRYRHSSEEAWRVRLEAGEIERNGQRAAAGDILETGDQLVYHRPPWEEPDIPMDFDILYDDSEVMVIAKPSGLPVMPAGGFLENTLLSLLQRRFPRRELIPMHRLGRGTSGALLVACSPHARAHLSRQLRGCTEEGGEKTLQKHYRALIGACDLPERLTIRTPIGKVEHPRLGEIYAATPKGKHAYSFLRILESRPESTLLDVEITTGRPHQIRIHLASVGFPLLGDPLYLAGGQPLYIPEAAGRQPTLGDGGYLLHAHQLSFLHPTTEERISVIAPPPPLLRLASESNTPAEEKTS